MEGLSEWLVLSVFRSDDNTLSIEFTQRKKNRTKVEEITLTQFSSDHNSLSTKLEQGMESSNWRVEVRHGSYVPRASVENRFIQGEGFTTD